MTETEVLAMGIDPGNVASAVAVYSPGDGKVHHFDKLPNQDMFEALSELAEKYGPVPVAIEQIRSYGMAVGATVFDTVHWSGRFHQYLVDMHGYHSIELMPRRDVKMHLCGNNRAKDANVNQAIADRYGGSMKVCKGTKKNPGPLYGISGDMWAALGVAITLGDNLVDGRYVAESACRR